MLASPDLGRIGVAAIDFSTGQTISVLGDQPFPMASTSKIAIVATFLDGVDSGRFRLSDQYPLLVPVPSKKYSTLVAPVRQGQSLSAQSLIELTIARSDNQATDALLAAVGGPAAVNRWMRNAGIADFRLDRDIATLVRDDGAVNPATTIDLRDSATPLAMTRLLAALYRGELLSPSSRNVLIGAMERCVTGKRRIPGQLPAEAWVAHKTGTLSNTSSDVGLVRTPDGRTFAVAVYVTGQGGKTNRDAKIAAITRALYDGYRAEGSSFRRTAQR
jgi:beta-lactamase class A